MPTDPHTTQQPTAESAWNDVRRTVKHDMRRSVQNTAAAIRHIAALRRLR